MNQLCKVCGELAAGFHFGTFTCEGCKSFFGRTYNNQTKISKCKNHHKCIITKTNRTACKECRLKKCLLVGMSKNGSRYGRRSNWFKIHCLLSEQNEGEGDSQYLDLFSSNYNEYLFKINRLNFKEDEDSEDAIPREFGAEKMVEKSATRLQEYMFFDATNSHEQIEPIDLSMKLKPR